MPTCTKCQQNKPDQPNFWHYRSEKRPDGLFRYRISICRDCITAYRRGRENATRAREIAAIDSVIGGQPHRLCKTCGTTKPLNSDNFRNCNNGSFSRSCKSCLFAQIAKTCAARVGYKQSDHATITNRTGDEFAVLTDSQIEKIQERINKCLPIKKHCDAFVTINIMRGNR